MSMRPEKKEHMARKRHWRVRKKVVGSSRRPRLSVCFTEQHIYVQFIDDEGGRTLAATSTRSPIAREGGRLTANVAGATRIGQLAAEAAKAQGIEEVVFDRGGKRYHGKVKALADAARESGLKF
jgi:large subunit ribosomal protein L18